MNKKKANYCFLFPNILLLCVNQRHLQSLFSMTPGSLTIWGPKKGKLTGIPLHPRVGTSYNGRKFSSVKHSSNPKKRLCFRVIVKTA